MPTTRSPTRRRTPGRTESRRLRADSRSNLSPSNQADPLVLGCAVALFEEANCSVRDCLDIPQITQRGDTAPRGRAWAVRFPDHDGRQRSPGDQCLIRQGEHNQRTCPGGIVGDVTCQAVLRREDRQKVAVRAIQSCDMRIVFGKQHRKVRDSGLDVRPLVPPPVAIPLPRCGGWSSRGVFAAVGGEQSLIGEHELNSRCP